MNKKQINVVIGPGSDNFYIDFIKKLDENVNIIHFQDLINDSKVKAILKTTGLKKLNYSIYKLLLNYGIIPEIDLVVFTGGADVNPEFYHEKKGKYTHISDVRDELENQMYSLFSTCKKLGICRGAQFLTVRKGGSLIQHVEGHGESHSITIDNSFLNDNGKFYYIDNNNGHGDTKKDNLSKLMMTSSHHQMMFPYSSRSYSIVAWSSKFLSGVYLDGENQEKSLPDNFVEPEIVLYGSNGIEDNIADIICIQGHPEYPSCSPATVKMCLNLIKLVMNDKINFKYYKSVLQE